MVGLFEPLELRSLTLRNRIGMSPMCTYSCVDGRPDAFHLVHLGARALGGAGLVLTEATAIAPEGRISPRDAGIWSDDHVDHWRPVTAFLRDHGAVPGVQLAHAGRKAGTAAPWDGGRPLSDEAGGWEPIGPSAARFADGYRIPREASDDDLGALVDDWVAAAVRARAAGFEVLEIHAAHGYLLHEFLSPLANRRSDEHGGGLEGRMRFPLRVARAVREAWPDDRPILVRVSATDWVEGGWDLEQSVAFARELATVGVDLVDTSSGGIVPGIAIPAEPGYQVPFAERIRREAEIATAAVGLITEPAQADAVVQKGSADLVLLGRALLRDPHWPHAAATALGHAPQWPAQYERAAPAGEPTAIPR